MTRDLPSIMQEVFRRRGQPPPYPARAAELVWDRYGDDADVRLATAHCDGEAAAISVTLIDRDRAFMWDGGSRERYRRHSPDALLYWDSICWARERGCIAIDMVGSPEQGVADYKKSFGAVETPYLVANRVNSRLVALGRGAHNRATLLTYAVIQRLAAKRR
jgi:CelD/BcsL family acetyltransferase involved in cellulose biosynthesis